MFHSRPDSLLYLPNEEHVLGYLKFSFKGTKREVFGMPIPGNLITADIQGSDPDSLAPKPTNTTKKSKPTAPKAALRPPVTKPAPSQQTESQPVPTKTQGKKHKKNLAQHTHEKKKATLIVISSIRLTKLVIYHLQRKYMFHSRPDSLLYLPNEEHVLGYLKFSFKGTKREVFGMPIPGNLITADIQGSDPDSLAPKPTNTTKKSKPTAPKAALRPPVTKLAPSQQTESQPVPTKTQGKKHTSSIPPMTTPIIDLTSRPESPNVHQPLQATATETTTPPIHPLPSQPQQSTTDSMLMKFIGELEHIIANLIQENKHLEERLDSHGAHLYTLENLDIPYQVRKSIDEIVIDAVDWAIQALLQNRFRDLPEADMKEILYKEYGKPTPTKLMKITRCYIRNAHIPKVNLQQDWWKRLEEERPATPEPAWSISLFDVPVPKNNWASDLASTYSPPPEDTPLAQNDDIAMFMDWFCKRQGITKLKPQDKEGPAFELFKVFHPNVIRL
nr:E-beta-farnesene synthase [Tanacetum cinerariifolium]